VAPGEACYIPCGRRKGDGLSLDLSRAQDGVGSPMKGRCAALKVALETTVLKVGQNSNMTLIFLQRGIAPTHRRQMLISYVLEAACTAMAWTAQPAASLTPPSPSAK
jgi:hypothetical protein